MYKQRKTLSIKQEEIYFNYYKFRLCSIKGKIYGKRMLTPKKLQVATQLIQRIGKSQLSILQKYFGVRNMLRGAYIGLVAQVQLP